jgi:hypothetical protein
VPLVCSGWSINLGRRCDGLEWGGRRVPYLPVFPKSVSRFPCPVSFKPVTSLTCLPPPMSDDLASSSKLVLFITLTTVSRSPFCVQEGLRPQERCFLLGISEPVTATVDLLVSSGCSYWGSQLKGGGGFSVILVSSVVVSLHNN